MDLYVTNWGPNVLYHNNGDGTFTDVTAETGTGDPRWSSSAAFADFNGDGLLDLFVTNYVRFDPDNVPLTEVDGSPCTYRGVVTGCGPWRHEGERSTLYLQRADHTFIDASDEWGLDKTAGYRGMGVAAGDFDGDGYVDVYIGCDVMPNLYLENEGGRRFASVGLVRGGALNEKGMHESGMGVATADMFNRGQLDILTSNFAWEKTTYYRNDSGYFTDMSTAVGLEGRRAELGWGVVAVDFNQDGLRDVFVANGQVYPQVERLNDPEDRYEEPPRVYLGAGHESLKEIPPEKAFQWDRRPSESDRSVAGGADLPQTGGPGAVRRPAFSLRALAAGDLDNDGDVDLVAVRHNGPLVVFENLSDRPAAVVTLRTRRGGLGPTGAHISIGSWHHFDIPTQGYQCSHDPRVFINRPQSDTATVRWFDGTVETMAVPPPGRHVVWQPRKNASLPEIGAASPRD